MFSGKVRPAAAGDDCADRGTEFGGSDESGGRAGAGAEITERKLVAIIAANPFCDLNQAFGEKRDIEPDVGRVTVGFFLFLSQEVKKKSADGFALKNGGNKTIARAVPSAAAAMGEEDQA